jgi:predicted aspartyl protease
MNSLLHLFPFILACVFATGKVYGAGADIPQPVPPADRAAATVTVPFDLYDGYMIVAHGSAGPLKGLNFFVDTGTTLPVFDSKVLQKLHLQHEAPVSIVVLGGKAQGQEAVLPSLSFGPVQWSNLQVVTIDLSFFRKVIPVRIDAIVGLNVVGQRAFVIDYSARVIRFGRTPVLPVSVPLRMDGGLATFDAEIDHAPVHLAFDTGADSLILFNTDARSPGSKRKVEPDHIGNFTRKAVRLHSIRLGNAEFGQKSAAVVDSPKQSPFDFDGVVSPAALGIVQVSIDLQRGVLGFSR